MVATLPLSRGIWDTKMRYIYIKPCAETHGDHVPDAGHDTGRDLDDQQNQDGKQSTSCWWSIPHGVMFVKLLQNQISTSMKMKDLFICYSVHVETLNIGANFIRNGI